MRRQQDIAGHLGSHRAIAEDEMWEDREYSESTPYWSNTRKISM